MKTWLGPILLAVLLVLGLGTGYFAKAFHSPTAQLLEQASQAALAEQGAAAEAFVRQAENRWRQHWKLTAAFTDHNPMDAADELFAQAQALTEAKEWSDLAACCQQLAVVLRSVWEDQSLTWWNLL